MAKKYMNMSVEELVALQETASPEEMAAIEAELNRRAEAQGNKETEAPAETEAEVDEAEKLNALLAECQVNVGHRCRLVPAGTIEYVEGTIVGCVKIKRSNTVAYAVKLDNGARVVKNYKAPLFEILDEVVERAKVTRRAGSATKAEPWTDERMTEEINKYIGNVGRAIEVKTDNDSVVTGQITGIVPVKRSNSILYRVVIPAPTELDPDATATVHKSVANTSGYTILEETEESAKYLADYLAHREKLANKPVLTGTELILDLELKLEKAKDAEKKAMERVAALEKLIAEKKAEAETNTSEANDESML